MGHKLIIYNAVASIAMFAATGLLAQDQNQPHPWRPADAADQAGPAAPADPGFIADQAGPPPPPNFSANQQGGAPQPNNPQGGYQGGAPQPNYPQGGYQGGYAPPPQPMRQPVPAQLTIRPGTFISIRMNQGLSSDHAQQGDTFFATLGEPLIVDGVVIAQRGQTVMGRVTEAQKAGRVEGTSRLGIELTGLTLVDGQQVSIQSQMINRNGQTSVGRDVGAVAGTTALGAAIGASADWGRGAAIGAGAGAAAGIIGVLLTRGRPTIVYPESMLTFRISAPVTVATDRAPQAFHYATNQDYNRGGGGYAANVAPRPVAPPSYYYGAGGYYPGSYPGYYGYGYGPGMSFYFGPSWYGYRGGFYFRGRR